MLDRNDHHDIGIPDRHAHAIENARLSGNPVMPP